MNRGRPRTKDRDADLDYLEKHLRLDILKGRGSKARMSISDVKKLRAFVESARLAAIGDIDE